MKTVNHILAVIDDQPIAEEILKRSIDLANKFDAKLLVLHTIHIPFLKMPAFVQDVPIDKEKIKESIEEKIEGLQEEETISSYTMVYFGDATERAIVEAKRDDIDLIVTSASMNVERVIEEVAKPILVVNAPFSSYQNILIPTDLSEKSRESIAFAKEHFSGDMQLIYGYERIAMVTSMYDISYTDMLEYQEENRSISENLLKTFSKEVGVPGRLLDATFSLGQSLVEYIEKKKPDLVLVATGSSDEALNFGSISSYVAKESIKDVLIYY